MPDHAKLVWDQIGEREFETGIDRGVLYLAEAGAYPKGVAWNGLISIAENPSGAEDNAIYADNIKYLNLKSAEEFGLTLECYTYPDEWEKCDGFEQAAPGIKLSQQKRSSFGLCYRTLKGNDVDGQEHAYKLHLVYGCSASPSERSYQTVNESPEAITFSYTISTISVPVEGFKPTALITIESDSVDAAKLAQLEGILYGSDEADARLPLPNEIITLFAAAG